MGEWLRPVTIITTLQPMLVVWLLAISFFVTLAAVAMLSKGRKWYELACMFLVCFVFLGLVGLGIGHWVLDVSIFRFELIAAG